MPPTLVSLMLKSSFGDVENDWGMQGFSLLEPVNPFEMSSGVVAHSMIEALVLPKSRTLTQAMNAIFVCIPTPSIKEVPMAHTTRSSILRCRGLDRHCDTVRSGTKARNIGHAFSTRT